MNPVHSIASQAVQDTVARSSDVDACLTLTKRINSLLAQAIESFAADDARIACKEGCTFCCHLRVMVYPHEAIALFRYLHSQLSKDTREPIKRRIKENAALIEQRARKGTMPPNLPCAFLADGKCSAYEVRPNTCSGYHSLSRESCEQAFQARATSQPQDIVPVLEGLRFVAGTLDEGLDEALAAAGLSSVRIELHTAMAALLRNPSLIERWRAGRDLVKPATGPGG